MKLIRIIVTSSHNEGADTEEGLASAHWCRIGSILIESNTYNSREIKIYEMCQTLWEIGGIC